MRDGTGSGGGVGQELPYVQAVLRGRGGEEPPTGCHDRWDLSGPNLNMLSALFSLPVLSSCSKSAPLSLTHPVSPTIVPSYVPGAVLSIRETVGETTAHAGHRPNPYCNMTCDGETSGALGGCLTGPQTSFPAESSPNQISAPNPSSPSHRSQLS